MGSNVFYSCSGFWALARKIRTKAEGPWARRTSVMTMRRPAKLDVSDLQAFLVESRSLPVIVPLALEKLEEDRFHEGVPQTGRLLEAVVRVSPSFWLRHPDCHLRLENILSVLALRYWYHRPSFEAIFDTYLNWAKCRQVAPTEQDTLVLPLRSPSLVFRTR